MPNRIQPKRVSRCCVVPLVALVVLVTLAGTGCHDDHGHSIVFSDNAHVAGVWDVAIAYESGGRATAVLTLNQTHRYDWEVTGSFDSAALDGSSRGFVDGFVIDLQVHLDSPCHDSFRLLGVVADADHFMSGGLAGRMCGGYVEANFTAHRRR